MKKTRKLGKQGNTGGKVIASGGFGCIFKPALKCENEDVREEGNISKLMLTKHAKDEYEGALKYKKILERIPNYDNYFLLDGYSICDPAPLTKKDLKKFNSNCHALPKRNITLKKINKKLDELKIINMPYRGMDIGDYIKNNCTPSVLMKLNIALIDLLQNGIIPMNKAGVYHSDIKESNILIEKDTTLHPILIDWGLSSTYKKGDPVPSPIKRRSFQYNAPISIIIFNNKFDDMYNTFLMTSPSPDYYTVKEFVSEYILAWFEERGVGHFKILHEIIKQTFKGRKKEWDHISEGLHRGGESGTGSHRYIVTYDIIIDYITEVLVQYTSNGIFSSDTYFNELFIKNIDMWGAIMTYSPILEHYCNNYSKLSKCERIVYSKLQDMFIYLLFDSPLREIKEETLVKYLNELTDLWRDCEKNKLSHSDDESHGHGHSNKPSIFSSSYDVTSSVENIDRISSKNTSKILSELVKEINLK